MKLNSRFGPVDIEADDILCFPTGIIGWEGCRHWVLLSGGDLDAVAWLQCVDRPELAVPVVSPRRYLPSYEVRVARRELGRLELDDLRSARVLVIMNHSGRGPSLNLKAPIVLNPFRRLGCQVVTNGDLPVRYELGNQEVAVRRIA